MQTVPEEGLDYPLGCGVHAVMLSEGHWRVQGQPVSDGLSWSQLLSELSAPLEAWVGNTGD